MAEQYVMIDGGGLLVNPGMGNETYGVWRDKIYGWNPIISAPISFTGDDINLPSAFHNNINGAEIPYFDSSHVCQGILTITSATDANPITFTTSAGTRTRVPQAGDYLLSPQYDFTVARCLFMWADIEAVESSFDWTAAELVNGVKIVRELNRVIDLGWIDRKKKQICVYFVMDFLMSSSTDFHAGTCPSQSGMTSTQVKLASGASASDDLYNTGAIYITEGTGAGQVRTVSDYDGTNKVVTVSSAWSTRPDGTSIYFVTKYRQLPDWLIEDIACDGVPYIHSGSGGFSPNYANTTLIAKHALLLAALGTKYSGDEIFQRVIFSSLGHWGELHLDYSTISDAIGTPQTWTSVLANSVVNQYLDHYDDAFGAEYGETRRSIGDSGTMGFGLCCYGFGNDAQVWTITNGGIDSIAIGCNDTAGIAQAAISGWKARHKSIEPFGGLSNNPDMFRDEPTSIVTTDDMTKWEQHRWSHTTGEASENLQRWRTKADYSMAVTGGAEYVVKIRPSNYAADGVGYKCQVVEYTGAGVFVKSTTAVANGQKITLGATTGKVRFCIHIDNDNSTNMTEAFAKDSNLRFYATSGAGDEIVRNIEWTLKQLEDYAPLLYCDDISTKTVTDGGGTAANVAAFLKKIGYRLGVTVDSPTDASIGESVGIDVTVHNVGVAKTWLPGYKIEVSLLNQSTHAVVASTVDDFVDCPVGNTELDTIYIDTSGMDTTGTYDVAVAIYHPDYEDDLYVDFYGGSAQGMRYETTELILDNVLKSIETSADITPSIEKAVDKGISVDASITPVIQKRVSKTIGVTVEATPSIIKEAGKNISVDAVSTLEIAKDASKRLEAIVEITPSLIKDTDKNVSVDAEITPSIIKEAEKIIASNAEVMPSIIKDTGKPITVTVETASNLIKDAGKNITSNVEASNILSKGVDKNIYVAASVTPSLEKGVDKSISVSAEASMTLSKGVSKDIETGAVATEDLVKDVSKSIAVSATGDLNIDKGITKSVSVSVEAASTISKGIDKDISVSASAEPSIVKDVGKNVSVSVETSSTMQKQASKVIIAEVSMSEDITKGVGKKLMAVVVADSTITRNVSKVVLVSALTESTLQKAITKVIDTSVDIQPDIDKQIDKIISTNVVVTNDLIKHVDKTLTVVVVAISPVYSTDYFYQCIVECIERELTLSIEDGEEW